MPDHTEPTLRPPSQADIRRELEDLVCNDLHGPKGGATEELIERSVRDRYLIGMLAPRRQRVNREQVDDLAQGGADSPEEGPVDPGSSQAPTMFPSSFGFTCCLDEQVTALVVNAHWGHYQRLKSDVQTTDVTEEPRTVWRRHPRGGSTTIALAEGTIASWSPDPYQPEVVVRGTARRRDSVWIVTLFLVNTQHEPDKLRDTAWIFQPALSIGAPDQSPVFRQRQRIGMDDAGTPSDEDRVMQMLYRQQVEFAVGHGVSVHAEPDEHDPTRATRISTQVIPTYEVPRTTFPTANEHPRLAGLELDMRTLAQSDDASFAALLQPLVTAYADWVQAQTDRIAHDPDLAPFRETAQQALAQCATVRQRIQAGIDLLGTHAQAGEAFRFLNRAMWQQRIHTLAAERQRRGEPVDWTALDVPKERSWRVFQLAFILLNLPALTDLHHPERSAAPEAIADLLWFPTGGGKTEAYLGLTAYTIGIRRLQGTVAGRSGMDGVAVLMRYTLRLLTLQQFQRATALICACEIIRREALAAGDTRWGTTPFRIGLWVGMRTTPNTTDQSKEALNREHGQFQRASAVGGSGSPAQLTFCPWCGSEIKQGRDIRVDTVAGRTILACGDPLGECPFSAAQSPGEGLPVLVVDEEIYRRLPTLLIATVDKFAQLPWKGETQMIFGQVDGYCERHGFRSPEIEDSTQHPARGTYPAARTVPHSPLRPPDLIIQDELHLISGPLGTLVGLYESAVDRLTSWEVDGQQVRPKVIASTATVRRAAEQIHALFLRQVSIFPPPGLDATDNFFAVQRPATTTEPGRRYLGICAIGKRQKAVLIRVYVALLAAAQHLYEQYGAHTDPWMTLVGYFNAMRELGGMRRLVEDDVRSRLDQADTRGLAKRGTPYLEELTSRKGATDIPRVLDMLERPFAQPPATSKKRGARSTNESPRALDVLLATNMISVGVDVRRLGLMVVSGQPKTTAEYIQATSRVGRSAPGLVVTIFNWSRPRDLSHYEQFEHYHATFYQHVEALSVTPFAARALDRGLTALLVSYVRLLGQELNANDRAGRITGTHPYVLAARHDLAHRAALASGTPEQAAHVTAEIQQRIDAWLAEAQRPTSGRVLGYKERKDGVTVGLLKHPETADWQTFTCLNSLRDVEPGVGLILNDAPLGSDIAQDYRAYEGSTAHPAAAPAEGQDE
jgi:hypothetical protein